MSETLISLSVQFASEAQAQGVQAHLDLPAHTYELSTVLASLAPEVVAPPGQDIDIERVERQGSVLTIAAYAGRIDPPLWLVPGLVQLGATRIVLSESADDGGTQYYFIGGKKVSKKAFEASAALMPKPPLQAASDQFLPNGRVSVKATLLSHEWKASRFERYCVMHMQAEDGRYFLYKGTAALTKMTEDDHEKTCTFSAVFEAGEYDGKIVAFAQRPTKIQIGSVAPSAIKAVKFTDRNKAFMADVFGPLITRYFDELGGKPDAFIQQMSETSVLGIAFTDLFALLKNLRAYSFSGFGHYVSVSDGDRAAFEIYTVGDVPIDFSAARRHLNALNVTEIYRSDGSGTSTLFWTHEGIRVRFKVWAKGFECFLDIGTTLA